MFTDLKLNSDHRTWRGVIEGLSGGRASRSSGSRRCTSDGNGAHALDRATLTQAADAGLVRLTTGLESGSQRMLDLMKKGTDLGETSRVLRDAAQAGISVRVTVMVGYPGEAAADVAATARFLDQHRDSIERVSLNRFTLMSGTAIDRLIAKHRSTFRRSGYSVAAMTSPS